MYELAGVSKAYRAGSRTVEAVPGAGLTVADGEWAAIRGRTGSGKPTLLNLPGGLDRPASGQVRLDGRDLARLSDAGLTRVRAHRPPRPAHSRHEPRASHHEFLKPRRSQPEPH